MGKGDVFESDKEGLICLEAEEERFLAGVDEGVATGAESEGEVATFLGAKAKGGLAIDDCVDLHFPVSFLPVGYSTQKPAPALPTWDTGMSGRLDRRCWPLTTIWNCEERVGA